MSRLLPTEYVYREEIAPILALGVVLNLFCSYLVALAAPKGDATSFFSVSVFFQDTGGTAFAALALGPWWGAIVGVVSSSLNSLWNDPDFYAYALVNVGLGLAWGYVGRWINVHDMMIEPKLFQNPVRMLLGAVALILAGAAAATILADVLKLSLIVLAGGNLFQGHNQPLYMDVLHFFGGIGLPSPPLALMTFDFYANLLDKGLSVIIGLILLNTIGVVPWSSTHRAGELPITARQRLRVGADSVMLFAAAYATYLLVARLVFHAIRFTGSGPAAGIQNWTKTVGIPLLLPFAVAFVAFVLGTLSTSRPVDRQIEENFTRRWDLYRRLRKPATWSRSSVEKSEYFAFLQQNSVYGLGASLALWPVKSGLGAGSLFAGYVLFLVVCSTSLFFERREGLRRFCHALDWSRRLDDKYPADECNLEGAPVVRNSDSAPLIALLLEIANGELAAASVKPRQIGTHVYQVANNVATAGWLEEMRRERHIDHLIVLAAGFKKDAFHFVQLVSTLLERHNLAMAVIIDPCTDDLFLDAIHQLARKGRYLVCVVQRMDIRDMIDVRAEGKGVGSVLARARIESRFFPVIDEKDIVPDGGLIPGVGY